MSCDDKSQPPRPIIWQLGCRIVVIDDIWQPPLVEASFADAHGNEIRIRDKLAIFCAGNEPQGAGVVECRLTSGAVMGDPAAICAIDIAYPSGLATADGATTFEVRADSLAPATPLPEGWVYADRDEARSLLDELERELPPDHLLFGVRVETLAHRQGATDDVAFRHLDDPERITVVHLTWLGRTELDRHHPAVVLDGALDDLIAEEKRQWGLEPG